MKDSPSSCHEMARLLSEYVDDLLPFVERHAVEAHLVSCSACTAVLAEYREIGTLLRKAPRVTPPPDVRRRVMTHKGLGQRGRASHTLLTHVGAIAALALWVVGVLWLFRGGEAAHLLNVSPAAAPASGQSALAARGNTASVGSSTSAATAPDGLYAQAPAFDRAELRWVYRDEVWTAPIDGDARLQGTLPTPEGTLIDFVSSWQGKHIAYVLHSATSANLRVATADGQDSRLLLTASYLSGLTWSLDDQHLFVFAGDDAQQLSLILVDSVDGSHSTLSMRAPFAFWSPDGRYVAYTEPLAKNGTQRIRIVEAPGGAAVSVVEAALPEGYLAWAPDSSRLLFAAYTRRAEDGDNATGPARIFGLTPGENMANPLQSAAAEADYLHPQLSPDCRGVAFLYHLRQEGEPVPPPDVWSLHTDLAVVGSDGKNARPLVGATNGQRIGASYWSPDGRYLAYLVTDIGGAQPGQPAQSQIFLVSAKGGSPRAVSPLYTDGELPGKMQWVVNP